MWLKYNLISTTRQTKNGIETQKNKSNIVRKWNETLLSIYTTAFFKRLLEIWFYL